jgi:hypothetical protein
VEHGEVSLLAIMETLTAIALVFYLSTYLNALGWLAWAMCASPLLLLRTEESTRLGIALYDRMYAGSSWLNERDDQFRALAALSAQDKRWMEALRYMALSMFFSSGLLLAVSLSPPIARISATVVGSLRRPLDALSAIPKNWSRVTLATDSFAAPELIPGHPRHTLHYFIGFIKSQPRLLGVVGGTAVFSIFFLPALLYRWSLKATSVIYAPLVFIVHVTFRDVPDLRTKLELMKRSDITRILAFYAVCYVTAFLTKLALMIALPGFAEWWTGTPMREFAALYVAPSEIPKWQLASLMNCAVALGVWLFARQALLRIEVGTPWRVGPVQRTIGFATGVRTVLAIYTIACTGYLTLRAARGWHWPALGEKWLPWQ